MKPIPSGPRASGASAPSAPAILGVLLLVMVTFFIRGNWFGGRFGSLSYLLPLLGTLLLLPFVIGQLWRAGAVALPPFPYLLLAGVAAFNLAINALFNPSHLPEIVLFAAEITLNAIVFLVAYNLGRTGMDRTDWVLRMIQRAGVISASTLAVLLISADTFSRISFAATGVNHLGHALAVLAMISLYRTVSEIRVGHLLRAAGSTVVFSGALFLLFLSGTRSAMAGLAIALLMVLWLRGRRRDIVMFYPAFAAIAVLMAAFFLRSTRFAGLVRRFDPESIAIGIGSRFELWIDVLSASTVWSAAFGAPWLYEIIAAFPRMYPHNMMLSVGLYMGAIPLLLCLWILGSRMYYLYRHSQNMRRDLLAPTLLGVLIIILVYASLSGSFTRVITIAFVLGLAEAWLRVLRDSAGPSLPTDITPAGPS